MGRHAAPEPHPFDVPTSPMTAPSRCGIDTVPMSIVLSPLGVAGLPPLENEPRARHAAGDEL